MRPSEKPKVTPIDKTEPGERERVANLTPEIMREQRAEGLEDRVRRRQRTCRQPTGSRQRPPEEQEEQWRQYPQAQGTRSRTRPRANDLRRDEFDRRRRESSLLGADNVTLVHFDTRHETGSNRTAETPPWHSTSISYYFTRNCRI